MAGTAALGATLYLLALSGSNSLRTADHSKSFFNSTTTRIHPLPSPGQDQYWVTTVKRDLDILAQAQPSWRTAFNLAEMVLHVLDDADLRPDRIMPSSENGFIFYFFRADGYAMIECLTSKEIIALTKDETSGQRQVWEVDLDQAEIRSATDRIRSFTTRRAYEHTAASSRFA